jgi:hypothetical protein
VGSGPSQHDILPLLNPEKSRVTATNDHAIPIPDAFCVSRCNPTTDSAAKWSTCSEVAEGTFLKN